MKRMTLIVLFLLSNIIFCQKIKLIDNLNEQILSNKKVGINNVFLETDSEGYINLKDLQEFNNLEMSGYEIFHFYSPISSKEFRLDPKSHNIEEVKIIPIDNETINFKTLRKEKFTYSIRNNAILVNQLRILSKLKKKRIIGIVLNLENVNPECNENIFVKPILFSEKNNAPDIEIDKSEKIYEINNQNKSIKLKFINKIDLDKETYFIGFELLNMSSCEKPYKIFAKRTNNPSFYKIVKDNYNGKWLPNMFENKYINFGIDIIFEK